MVQLHGHLFFTDSFLLTNIKKEWDHSHSFFYVILVYKLISIEIS